jgi:hypothetical protein
MVSSLTLAEKLRYAIIDSNELWLQELINHNVRALTCFVDQDLFSVYETGVQTGEIRMRPLLEVLAETIFADELACAYKLSILKRILPT